MVHPSTCRYCNPLKSQPWEGGGAKAAESSWSFLSSVSQVRSKLQSPTLDHFFTLFDPQERGLSEMYTGQEGDGWPRVFTVQVKGKQVLESASTLELDSLKV